MADLFITEYADTPLIGLGKFLQVGVEPAVAEQAVTIGVASVQSAALNGKTKLLRVHAEAACAIAFGVNPTAVATTHRLPAGAVEYYGVTPGDDNGSALKVAVIQDS
jgi:hypothetical protein